MRKLLFGHGVNKTGRYTATFRDSEGKQCNTKEYNKWYDMLRRCYSKNRVKWVAYNNCTVSENFKCFQFFAEWCNKQKGFNEPDCQLDKDILGDGKFYSENNCCFVPRQINMLLASSKIIKNLPVGVSIDRYGNFVARIKINNKKVHISQHDNFEEAGIAYKLAKQKYLKDMACDYKEVICEEVYNKLANYSL